jgi:hypothetical protein
VDVTRSTRNIGAPSPPPDDGAMEALPRPAGISTIINAAADDKTSKITAAGPSTAVGLPPAVGSKKITTANFLAHGVSKLAEPVANNTIGPDNICELTGQISVTRPERKGNLKDDEDYEKGEKGDPWDKFALSEINDQYYAVAVVKNENSFGIYADVRKFKE